MGGDRAAAGGGNGGELHESANHRPKFCSAFSSCALAVNTFGRFDETAPLPLPGGEAFPGGVRFEAQRTAAVRGYKPNLDLVAEPADGAWLYVESKCLEYLRPHATAFSDAFVAKAEELLFAETPAFYAAYAESKKAAAHMYELLDAAQLLKHFLAAKVASGSERKIVLTYVFWEPADATDHQVFGTHRDEAQQLASALADEHVRLVALGYRDVWEHWEQLGGPDLTEHVAALRARYDVGLGPLT